jgi:hypothetical protein
MRVFEDLNNFASVFGARFSYVECHFRNLTPGPPAILGDELNTPAVPAVEDAGT